jgi:hemin uptake protein HemP
MSSRLSTNAPNAPYAPSAKRERCACSETPHFVRRYRTEDLLQGCPWVVLEHGGAAYRLQVTRLGKLILTK